MGLPDLYPFVLSPAVVAKLRFINEVIASGAAPAQKVTVRTELAS